MKVYLKKAKVCKFGITFNANVPLQCDGERVKHQTKDIWVQVKPNEIKAFLTHNDTDIDCGGTSLIDTIDADYNDLKKAFGKPMSYADGDKTDAEWNVVFPDGLIGTIYNYKSGKNYNGASGTPKTKITDWHIGGGTEIVVDRIKEILTEL